MRIKMKKYFFESILIIGSVLLSLYIDSLIKKQEKIDQKKSILLELKGTLNEDIKQLQDVIKIQKRILKSNELLINDYYGLIKLDKNILADHFSLLKQLGPLSVFIQTGPYTQLIQTGALELIKNEKLRSKLLYAYDSFNKRKQSGDDTLDEFAKEFGRDMAQHIVVTESIVDEEVFYKRRKVDKFVIGKNYYNSSIVIYLYSEYKFWIEAFISIHNKYITTLNEIELLIEKELGK